MQHIESARTTSINNKQQNNSICLCVSDEAKPFQSHTHKNYLTNTSQNWVKLLGCPKTFFPPTMFTISQNLFSKRSNMLGLSDWLIPDRGCGEAQHFRMCHLHTFLPSPSTFCISTPCHLPLTTQVPLVQACTEI